MKLQYLFLFVLAISFTSAWADNSSAYQLVDGCGNFTTANAYYKYNASFTTSITRCHEVLADNITVDMNGQLITVSTSGRTWLYLTAPYKNVTVTDTDGNKDAGYVLVASAGYGFYINNNHMTTDPSGIGGLTFTGDAWVTCSDGIGNTCYGGYMYNSTGLRIVNTQWKQRGRLNSGGSAAPREQTIDYRNSSNIFVENVTFIPMIAFSTSYGDRGFLGSPTTVSNTESNSNVYVNNFTTGGTTGWLRSMFAIYHTKNATIKNSNINNPTTSTAPYAQIATFHAQLLVDNITMTGRGAFSVGAVASLNPNYQNVTLQNSFINLSLGVGVGIAMNDTTLINNYIETTGTSDTIQVSNSDTYKDQYLIENCTLKQTGTGVQVRLGGGFTAGGNYTHLINTNVSKVRFMGTGVIFIYENQWGKVNFTQVNTGIYLDWDNYLKIRENNITITNSSINKSAVLTIKYPNGTYSTPTSQLNGADCGGDCTYVSNTSTSYTFSISTWKGWYSIAEGAVANCYSWVGDLLVIPNSCGLLNWNTVTGSKLVIL